MIIVLPFFSGDAWLAAKNLEHWIRFEPKVLYDCLLTYDDDTDPTKVRALAEQFFCKVYEHKYVPPMMRKWPYASNHAFQQTGWHIYNSCVTNKLRKDPWLWVESDCTAMRPGWIQAIDECHTRGGKLFTGHLNMGNKVWNGVSVYPWNAVCQGHHMWFATANPWDVVASEQDKIQDKLNVANHLFQHTWDDPETHEPCTFRTFEDVKRLVREGIVLFHRCKDGTLMDVMDKHEWNFSFQNSSGSVPAVRKQAETKTLLVAPFCNKDAECALLNFQLMNKWNDSYNNEIMLAYDDLTELRWIDSIHDEAKKLFRRVRLFCFPAPPQKVWPSPQNASFRAVARYVETHFTIPWMWWEPDATPLHKGWYTDLVMEYVKAGKPFMGHVVKSMGHMNGTAFYPWNLSKYSKEVYTSDLAFDVALKRETIHLTHDSAHLLENIFSLDENGIPTNGGGKKVSFKDKAMYDRYVNDRMCLFHKCSDGSLARMLMQQ